jgi:O-antigen ligase
MRPTASSRPPRNLVLTILFALLAFAALLSIGAVNARRAFLVRGIPESLPTPIPAGGVRLGVTAALDVYSDTALQQALTEMSSLGIQSVRQTFYFREGEPFDWATVDRLMAAAAENGINLIPLLDGDPATGYASPSDYTQFATWAAEFARRYGSQLSAYIIWDEPNLRSHWGDQPVNPAEYTALLTETAAAIRQADPTATIVAAPLAPTSETGPDNLAEPLYLQAMLQAGAAESFDAVAAKPYGFDTGPDDRRVAIDILNVSRVILLRETLEAQGAGDKAVWAGNWGWNSLPAGWTGSPSIWGQTSDEQRAIWVTGTLERAQREWPWMGVMFLESWNSGAPADDPRRGFSIPGTATAATAGAFSAAQDPLLALPGYHPASESDPAQVFVGDWELSPQFGADIGASGDRVSFRFWGTDVGIRVRRADYRARFYATIDGEPANALPHDENGAALVLTAPDAAEDYVSLETLARDLPPGEHVLELVAARGWDQWALQGFSASYRPSGTPTRIAAVLFALSSLLFAGLAVWAGRGVGWVALWRSAQDTLNRLGDGLQLALVTAAASLVTITGWLTWGPETVGLYRRLGDAGQFAATAAAATIFYVTPTVFVFLLALAALFFLLLLRPAWGIPLIVFTMPFYVAPLPKAMFGYRFSPVEVFTLVTFAAFALRTALDAGAAYRRTRTLAPRAPWLSADYAVLAFAAVATLSLLFTERVGVATTEWRVVIIEPVLFYVLLRGLRLRQSEMWWALDAFVLSGLVVAGFGLWQYATGQDLITAEGGLMRLRSIYGSPNNVALYLGRILPFLVAMGLLGSHSLNGRRRSLYALAIVPIGLAIVLTFSKGALFLGVPAALFIVFWLWQRQNGRRTWPWAVAALTAGALALVVISQIPALAARLDLFGTTGVFRVNLWRASLQMWADHPWFGVGLDNFLYAYRGRYILEAAWQEPNLSHPHNLILDFGTRLGVFGLLAGLWLLAEAVRHTRRAIRSVNAAWLPVTVGIAGALAAIVAHGLVDHSFFLVDLAYVVFLLLGLAVWLTHSAHNRLRPPSSSTAPTEPLTAPPGQ